MRVTARQLVAICCVLAALAAGLSACTKASSTGAKSSTKSAPLPSSSVSGGTAPAGATKLQSRKIGILDVNASDPAAAQLEDSAKQAISTLHWTSVSVDAAGNPSKMAAGMQQLLVQNVDAILLDAVDPAAITQGLQQAKAKHVPVIVYGGQGTPSDLVSASIAPDDFTLASMVANYLTNSVGNTGNIAIMATDALTFSRNRTDLLKADLASYPGLKIVEIHQVDYANYVADVQTAVSALLKQYPDLSAIITTVSPYSNPAISELQHESRKVPVIGFYDTPSNLALVRSGGLTAVAATSFPQNAYQAVDALAEYFGRGVAISGASQYALPLRYTLVDASNIDSTSTTGAGAVDYKSFYLDVWKREFTNVS